MTPEDLTDDAKAILLLCGHFGKEACAANGFAPFSAADYGRLSVFLHGKGLRPASLLDDDVLFSLEVGMTPVEMPRVRSLLARGAAMSFAMEAWMNKGLWVLCRSDAAYPRRLKRQLREMAPPFLYGAGDQSLLDRGGLAIVGSRNIGPVEEAFASRAANRCATDSVQVVSGGARGVDQIAMREALESGGVVVGVLADSLLKQSLQKDHRNAIYDRRLVLVSAVHPEAGFSVGSAMGRNKYIYALADHGLVVQAEMNKGGTWSGAVEELERKGGRPVFVNPGFSPKKVVDALLAKGALPFPELTAGEPISDILEGAVAAARSTDPSQHSPSVTAGELCFSEIPGDAEEQKEEPASILPEPEVEPDREDGPDTTPSEQKIKPDQGRESSESATFSEPSTPATAFEAVWPLLQIHLAEPITPAILAEAIQVRKVQAEDWIKQALEAGLVRKLSKPARYVVDGREPQSELKLTK